MQSRPQRVAIYARYSTELQNPSSVVDQIAKCRRFAEAQGWRVVQDYSDKAVSGASNQRPGYLNLIDDFGTDAFDIVLTESLDRISRDAEDTAHFYKRAQHRDIHIHTLDQGKVGLLKIGFSGLMGSMFLEALSQKTHRGVEAAVQKGQSGGGRSYGYQVARTPQGDRITGALDIVPAEAAVIRRIFQDYANGVSPQQIATALNAEGVPAPRSGRATDGRWRQNTINGNRERGTGILNNELYNGRRIWNRLEYRKHPDTRKRVSRPRPREDWQVFEEPDLRIIDAALWDAVKARQGDIQQIRATRPKKDRNGLSESQATRRRKYLLSGLVECGQCGGNMTVAGAAKRKRDYCANHKEKGASVCSGMPGVLVADLEPLVLEIFKCELMTDAAYARFQRDVERHLEAAQDGARETVAELTRQLKAARRRREGLMVNIEAGRVPTSVFDRLEETEAEITRLESASAAATPHAVELPENLPELYRARVRELEAVLGAQDAAGTASEEVRALIDRLVIRSES
ncbi:recombinase family protein [Meridianimarinicoccus aquatilis]|uniref:Recombinase family protein n=1 Tax=Meridianimarinicoccus aquatilis TaxID=2552766 RepID=A0A4R6AK00_9RHOB|nr:recombinase family protein [Fluviibacterium aquatile]TDL83494.1 recombinase family protein [Fluviibacterium aquatile]